MTAGDKVENTYEERAEVKRALEHKQHRKWKGWMKARWNGRQEGRDLEQCLPGWQMGFLTKRRTLHTIPHTCKITATLWEATKGRQIHSFWTLTCLFWDIFQTSDSISWERRVKTREEQKHNCQLCFRAVIWSDSMALWAYSYRHSQGI